MQVRNSLQQLPPYWQVIERSNIPPSVRKAVNHDWLGHYYEFYCCLGWFRGHEGVELLPQCIQERDESEDCEEYGLSVIIDEEEVYSEDESENMRNLVIYEHGWMVETYTRTCEEKEDDCLHRDVIKNGISLNKANDYDESFGLNIIEGKPFYFFRKHNRYWFVYDSIEYPLEYERILITYPHGHYVQPMENGVTFYATFNNRMYYVSMGVKP